MPVLRRSLLTLEQIEMVVRAPRTGYTLAPNVPDLHIDLWAFELKISNWRRALFQACQYQAFAQAALVVLSELGLRRVEHHLDRFKTLGVGLLAFNGDGHDLQVVLRPQQIRPRSHRHYLYALGRVLAQTSGSPHDLV